MYPRRMLLTVYARLALWIIGAGFVAWLLLGSGMINDFITFLLSGTVPGTDVIVSPNAVILIAAGCLAALLGTLAIRTYVRHIRRQTGPVWKAEPQQSRVVHVTAPNESPRDVRLRNFGVPRMVRLRVILAVWQQYSSATLSEIGMKAAAVLGRIGHSLLISAARILVLGLITTGIMYRLCAGALRYIGAQAASVWRALEPYLWRLDGWLEKQVRAGMSRLIRSLQRFELTTTIQEIIRSFKARSVSLQPQPAAEEQNTTDEQQD